MKHVSSMKGGGLSSMKHVIFYDGSCPLCNRMVRFLLKADKENLFYFAPLNGVTAEKKLSHLYLKNPELDTLVLLLNYNTSDEKILIEGKGALRILWKLGGKYAWLGWFSFLPPFITDLFYRLIARNRYHLFSFHAPLPKTNEKFLP